VADDLLLSLKAADVADRVTLSYFRRPALAVEHKADLSPVTEGDRGAEAAVRDLIGRERPGDAVVGEEMGVTGASLRRWVVDPIDGTANFVRGIPVWATLIALEVEGEIRLGVVSAPALGRRWWAERGGGAFASGPAGEGARMSVSKVADLSEATLSNGCLAHYQDPLPVVQLTQKVGRDRGFGDFWSHMLVAEGCADIGLDPVVSLWDVAALQVIVEEAGGQFTDFSGQRRLDTGSAISSNGLLHSEVLSALSHPVAGG
jgi:histidinol-phosphatase